MKKCPFCAEKIQDEAIVCKHCGRDIAPEQSASPAPPPRPKKKIGCVAVGCAVLLGIALLGGLMSWVAGRAKAPSVIAPPRPAAMSPERTEARRREAVTQGIAAAKDVVSKEALCTEPKSVAAAWGKIRQASKTDPEWAEAQRLTTRLENCRRRYEVEEVKFTQNAQALLRAEWAKSIEQKALDSGMDIRVRLSAPVNDRVTLHWVLMSRVAVHKLTDGGSSEERSFLGQAEALGIRRVTFTDDSDFTSWYDLKPKPVTASKLAGLGLGKPLVLSDGPR